MENTEKNSFYIGIRIIIVKKTNFMENKENFRVKSIYNIIKYSYLKKLFIVKIYN